MWLKAKERWVWAFRKRTYNFNMSTTNDYLKDMKKCCLSDMINVSLTKSFPDSMRKYITLNIKCWEGCKKYSDHLPAAFLINRPKDFVNHARQRYINAEAFILKILQKKSLGFSKSRNNHTKKETAKNFTVSVLGAKMSFLRAIAETGNEISCHVNIFVQFSCQNLPGDERLQIQ